MATTTKQRQPRLRASCDGCFTAKVKCSKARPICSRCLTCGIECRYSPSSRAGKPKSSASSNHHHSNSNGNSPVSTESIIYSVHPGMTDLYKIETGWNTPPTDGNMSRTHSVSSGLALMGVDERLAQVDMDNRVSGDMYGANLPWTPPNELTAQFSESPLSNTMVSHGHTRSQSYDMSNTMGWVDPTGQDMFAYNQVPTPVSMQSPNYFPSPTATPNLSQLPPRSKSTGANTPGGSCTCFTVCLQSLQALHNASSPESPPFDLVLSLNRKAVEGCAAMLSCSRCMSRSGTHTAAMLLATVIGKIASFYKHASQSHFEHGGGGHLQNGSIFPQKASVGVSIGTYTIKGEDSRWLELEILARELRKLEEVYSRFREMCAELSEDQEVSKAMIGYLGYTLRSTLEIITHRRGDMGAFA